MLALNRFLSRLRAGEFTDEIPKAIDQLELFLTKFPETQKYFTSSYLPELYAQDQYGKVHFYFLVRTSLDSVVPVLAHNSLNTLIIIYEQNEDDEALTVLIEIIIKYHFYDVLSIESTGQKLRFQGEFAEFLLDLSNIRSRIRAKLLQLSLRRYSVQLLNGVIPTSQELPAIIQRLEFVVTSLLKYEVKEDLLSVPNIKLFAYVTDVSFDEIRSLDLFGTKLDAEAYDEQLYANYKVPLFPVIQVDKIVLHGRKLGFTNEGKGCLPPSTIYLSVLNSEFKLGDVQRITVSNTAGELYIEDVIALTEFLEGTNPNTDAKIVFSFSKFAHDYRYSVPFQSTGYWLEKLTIALQKPNEPLQTVISGNNNRVQIIKEGTGNMSDITGGNKTTFGNVSNSIINTNSTLTRATQQIQQLPSGIDNEARDQMLAEIEKLRSILEQVEDQQQAATIAAAAEKLAETVNDSTEDRDAIEFRGNKLKQAAENLKNALPVVLVIAREIVTSALRYEAARRGQSL